MVVLGLKIQLQQDAASAIVNRVLTEDTSADVIIISSMNDFKLHHQFSNNKDATTFYGAMRLTLRLAINIQKNMVLPQKI